jgi:hypothetical protein
MADYKTPQSVLNQLQKYFSIGWKKSNDTQPSEQLYPLRKVTDLKGNSHFEKEKFNDEIKKLFNWWVNSTHDSRESWLQRTQLFQDMDMIELNMAMISKSMNIMADEVVQSDSNMQPIFVEAKRNVKKFILDWFDKVGIFTLIRPTVYDIIKYGNAGWLLGFDESGVNEILPIDIYDLKNRMEFTPDEVQKQIIGDNTLFSQFSAHDRIKDLIDSIMNKENITSFFKSYLFGFQINDNIIPPWRFIHFRNFTTSSPFKPFGVPIFIHSVAPYRQWDAAMTMQIVARGANFPKEKYEINLPNAVDPSTKLELAVEFLNELMNAGIGTSKKELPGVNEIRITIKDLFEWSVDKPGVELGKIDDIKMLLDEVANSTFLPRNLIDPESSGFGDSGTSLVEKFKPFARLVFRIQSIFLSNLSQAIKIHMIHSQQFSEEEMDFVLSMPYPESQVNTEIISSQTAQWGLANEIISSLSSKLLGGESLPTDVVKQVYQKILPYDDVTIDNFINGSIKAREENDVKEYESQIKDENKPEENELQTDTTENKDNILDAAQQNIDTQKISVEQEKINIAKIKNANERAKLDKEKNEESAKNIRRKQELKSIRKWKKLEESIGKVKLQEEIDNEIFQVRQDNLREGVFRRRHYFSSKNQDISFPAEKLIELDKSRLLKLTEQDENMSLEDKIKFNKSYYKEEVKYTFKPNDKDSEKNK